MTLTYFRDNQELLNNAVLWYTGRAETNLGFPILPSGVTVTPAGTWANDLSLGNNKTLKTFNGSTNYISLTDVSTWNVFGGNFTIFAWVKHASVTSDRIYLAQAQNSTNFWWFGYRYSTNTIALSATVTSALFGYSIPYTGSNGVWFHIAVVGSGSTVTMYVNGSAVTTTGSGVASCDISSVLYIGFNSFTYYHAGNLKDVGMLTLALTPEQITTLMRLTNPNTGREFELLYPGVRGVE